MTKITNSLTIKEPDMFLRKVDLIQEYVFQRIKNALDSIKLNQEKLSNISEQDEVKNLLQSEFHKAMISMSKQDISCLFSVARDFNEIIELEFWKQQVLQDAGKVLFKDWLFPIPPNNVVIFQSVFDATDLPNLLPVVVPS